MKMKNNSINCVVDFSAMKMLKMGFWAGIGMFAAKSVCTVMLGKAVGKIAFKCMKDCAGNAGIKFWDTFEKALKERIESSDPETIKKMEEELKELTKKEKEEVGESE